VKEVANARIDCAIGAFDNTILVMAFGASEKDIHEEVLLDEFTNGGILVELATLVHVDIATGCVGMIEVDGGPAAEPFKGWCFRNATGAIELFIVVILE
jgi:hypothetical protein